MDTEMDRHLNAFSSHIKQFGSHVNLSGDGELIFLIRTGLRLTQHDFAEKLGVSKNTPGNWEKRDRIGKSKKELLLEKLKPDLKKQGVLVTNSLSSYEEKVDFYNQIRGTLVPKWDQVFKINYEEDDSQEEISISSGYPGSLIEQIRITLNITQEELSASSNISLDTIKSWTTRKKAPTATIGRENAKAIAKAFKLPKEFQKDFIDALDQDRETESQIKDGESLYTKIREWLLPPLKPITPLPPERPESFIGRVQLSDQIEADLESGFSVGLYGQLGIGKTTLLKELCHRLRSKSKFPGGYAWIQSTAPENLYTEILTQFYQDEKTKGKIEAIYKKMDDESLEKELQWTFRDKVHDSRPFLLVIDSVLSTCAITKVREYLPESCCILFATQSKEVIDKFKNIDGVSCFDVPHLSPQESIELLRQKSPLQDYDADAIFKNLASILRGLPLALNIAGSVIKAIDDISVEKIQSKIGESIEPGTKVEEKNNNTQSTTEDELSALIGLVNGQLSINIQVRFRQLGVFAPQPSAFTEEALQKVWGISEREQRKTCEILSAKGLLACEDTAKGYYSIHPFISMIAFTYLNRTEHKEQRRESVLTHARYYQNLLCKADSFLSFHQERGQINHARHNLLNQFPQEKTSLLRFAETTIYFDSIYPSSAAERAELLSRVLKIDSVTNVSWFMLHLANAFFLAQQIDDARNCYLAIGRGDTGAGRLSRAYAAAFIGIGNCDASKIKLNDDNINISDDDFDEQQFYKAYKNLQKGEDLARPWRKDAHDLLFYAHLSIGDLYLKRYHFKEVLIRKHCDLWPEIEVHQRKNDAIADLTMAERNYQLAGKLPLSDRRFSTILERKLGDICVATSNPDEAISHYERSFELAKEIDHTLAMYLASKHKAKAHYQKGNIRQAQYFEQEAEKLKEELALEIVGFPKSQST